MSNLVPPSEIEGIVGAHRHAVSHFGRAVSSEQTVYILHSRECVDSGVDLRDCPFSVALDKGIDLVGPWRGHEDEAVVLTIVNGKLEPTP